MEYFILFLIFSFLGVGIEVIFSSIHDYMKNKDISLKGRSYLWMFLLYGIWGLIIGPLYNLTKTIPFLSGSNIRWRISLWLFTQTYYQKVPLEI